jgi:hypothetical protein
MAKAKSLEQLQRENEEMRKKLAVLESVINNHKEIDEDQKPPEIENPYTVTNRAVSELVDPKDTMFYLGGSQISLILGAFEFARLPSYFGEEPVTELAEYADRLKRYLVSKGGRGRRDLLRVLRVSSGQSRENVNKSIFKQLLGHGKQDVEQDEEE